MRLPLPHRAAADDAQRLCRAAASRRGAVAAESYLSAAPKAPLCKGPARERCLWQKKRPQRPSSHWPWRAATRAGKVSWQPGTVSRQADWGIDAEVYQHRITTPPALRATSPYTGEALTCVRRKRSGTAAQRTRDARPYYEDDCLGGGRRGRCLHRPVPRRGKNALPVRYGPKTPRRQGERPCRRGAYMGRGAPGTASAYSFAFPRPAEVDFRCPARGRGRPQPSRRIRVAASK